MTSNNLVLIPLRRLVKLAPAQASERFEAIYAAAVAWRLAKGVSPDAEALGARFLVLLGNTYPGNLFLPMMHDDVERGEEMRQVLLDLVEAGPHQQLAERVLDRFCEIYAEMWMDLAAEDPAIEARMNRIVPGLVAQDSP